MEYVITRANETDEDLMHYGVAGMRWGVRKASYYDKRTNANLRMADKAKTSRAKARALNRAEINKYYAGHARQRDNVKNLKDAALLKYGNKDTIRAMNAYSNIERNKAAASKTKLGKQYHTVAAKNNDEAIKIRKNILNEKGAANKAKAAVKGVMNMKVTSIAGRTRSVGEAYVESLIPGATLIMDRNYYKQHKKDFGKL